MTIDKKHDSNPDPITGEPGAHPAGVAGGAAGGALAGAAVGALAGPVGAAVGGAVGAVAGGLAGKRAAEAVNPTEEEGYWRSNYKSRPYVQGGTDYEKYGPAYRYGWESATKPEFTARPFEDVESDLGRGWTTARGAARSEWNEARDAARDAYERAQKKTTIGLTHGTDRVAGQKAEGLWEEVKGNWHQFKGSIKAKWNDLTDDDVDQMRGDRERIIGKIQERYGKEKWRSADVERELTIMRR